jgi:glycosyltransferase involved in cell wall biosynthesis
MFCASIIATIGRQTLDRAVESVLQQTFTAGDFEVIVVNDSGTPLPAAPWQQSERVRILDTNQHNRSVARNAGASITQARYLHFLDDDDYLLPGALDAFWRVAQAKQPAWLCGQFCLVDNANNLIATISPEQQGNCFVQLLASEWLPLQASLISAHAFFDVGGFAPLPSLLGGYEDIDLSRQIVYRHDVVGVTEEVAAIRFGDSGSTTDYANMLNQNRQSREKMLEMPGAFTRLRHSVEESELHAPFWQGRIVYYYLASLRWNLRRGYLLRAASRGAYSVAGILTAGSYLASRQFWSGATSPHKNQVYRAVARGGFKPYANTTWIE